MKLFHKLTFRKKIFAGNLLLLVITLIPSLILYQQTINSTIETNVSYMNQINGQVELNVETIFSFFDRVNYLHYADGELRKILVSDNSKKDELELFTDSLYVQNSLNHAFRASQFVLRGGIINKYGDVFCSISSDTKNYREYVDSLSMRVDWIDKDQIYFSPIHETRVQLSKHSVVTMLQRMYYYGSYVGLLCVDFNFEKITEGFDQSYTSDFASSYCVLSEGELLYNSKEAYLSEEELKESEVIDKISQMAEELSSDKGRHSGKIRIHGQEYLITAAKNNRTGWTIVQYVPMNVINGIAFSAIRGMLLVMLCVICLSIALSAVLSIQITKPLTHVIAAMEETTKGHLKLIDIPDSESNPEMLELLGHYNSMAQRINDYIYATYIYELNNKRIQLKMLRYQINPHFMYNTLNTISALAEIEGMENIVQVAESLSKILYYNVKGKDVVLVKDEIEYVNNYQQIQNIRFPGRFETVLNISDEARQCYMLKFLLQPLLENAISHGLSDKRTGARIEICAEVIEKDLMISVMDNGIGMDEETCEKWNRRLKDGDVDDRSEREDDNGIGLVNVNSRIKNFYGQAYGIKILSKKNEYTKVILRLHAMGTIDDKPEDAPITGLPEGRKDE